MSNSAPFVILNQAPDEAAGWAADNLGKTGFRTLRTFDLQAARRAHLEYPCPHHGTDMCSCQMVVLLVYTGNYPPATLVIHGSDDTSYFYLINLPQQNTGQQLEAGIRQSLAPDKFR